MAAQTAAHPPAATASAASTTKTESASLTVRLKRAYEASGPEDGERFLVERLWPRGLTKDELALTGWLKGLAPTSQLRKWYGHLPERWPDFVRQYETELVQQDKQPMLADLAQKARKGTVTLVFATRVAERSGAAVLRNFLLHKSWPDPDVRSGDER